MAVEEEETIEVDLRWIIGGVVLLLCLLLAFFMIKGRGGDSPDPNTATPTAVVTTDEVPGTILQVTPSATSTVALPMALQPEMNKIIVNLKKQPKVTGAKGELIKGVVDGGEFNVLVVTVNSTDPTTYSGLREEFKRSVWQSKLSGFDAFTIKYSLPGGNNSLQSTFVVKDVQKVFDKRYGQRTTIAGS